MVSGIDHVLDTNVVVGLLKGHAPAIELAEDAGLDLRRAAISQITRMELLGYPGLDVAEEAAIHGFVASLQVIKIDDLIEAEAIRLRRSSAIKLPDAIIAATAKLSGSRLLTLDQRLLKIVAS